MRAAILLLAAASAVLAQVDDNVITIAASRQLNVQPDQVSISVTVTTDQKQTLDTVVAGLPAGVTAANLSSVYGLGTAQVQWVFVVTVPIANLTSTLAALHSASNGFVSSTATAQQCPYPALIADARAQAAKVAAAAGVTLGPIVTMLQGTQSNVQSPYAIRSGEIMGVLAPGPLPAMFLVSSILTSPLPPACSLTVQFQIAQ